MHNKQIGNQAENLALSYLYTQGLMLVTRNFFSRFGEIDLIMKDGNALVFVEVRLRKNIDDAIESITYAKQKRLIKAAQYYLLKTKSEVECRFDAIAIDSKSEITWLKNIIIL